MSTVASAATKCSLNVPMARSAAFTRWLWGGTSKLDSQFFCANMSFDCLGAFIIHYIQVGLIMLCSESSKYVGECRDESGIGARRHRAYDDGVEVVNVSDKNILHVSERPDGKCTDEVSVHCSRVCIGKGSKAKHVLHGTRFVGWEDIVNIGAGLNDCSLITACRSGVGAVSTHVSFVGGG